MKKCKGQKIQSGTEICFVINKCFCVTKIYPYDFKIKLGDMIEFKRNEYSKDIIELVKVTEIIRHGEKYATIHLSYPKVKEHLKI